MAKEDCLLGGILAKVFHYLPGLKRLCEPIRLAARCQLEGLNLIRNQQVAGSNPIAGSTSSKTLPTLRGRLLFFISVLYPCKNLGAPFRTR